MYTMLLALAHNTTKLLKVSFFSLSLGHYGKQVQQYQNWAKEVMLETWQEHMDGVRTEVKVDLP
jgi:hypothetical protein